MNRQKLIDSYAVAFKLGCKVSMGEQRPSMIFDPHQSCYRLSPSQIQCCLLETPLLGAENCTGDWLFDAAQQLETSVEYLEAFKAGLEFKITPDDKPS